MDALPVVIVVLAAYVVVLPLFIWADNRWAAGAEQRAKNRRTDKRAALALGAWWRR